jgi:hypothetical protein
MVDLTREVLEECDKPVNWIINYPNMVWTACDEHLQFFKVEAERVGFEKVVEYDSFDFDLYHEKLKNIPADAHPNAKE